MITHNKKGVLRRGLADANGEGVNYARVRRVDAGRRPTRRDWCSRAEPGALRGWGRGALMRVVVAVVVTMPLVVGGPVRGDARQDLGGACTVASEDFLEAARGEAGGELHGRGGFGRHDVVGREEALYS